MNTNVTAAQIAVKYNLDNLRKINQLRQYNGEHVDSKQRFFKKENVEAYAIVSGVQKILNSQSASSQSSSGWINYSNVIKDLFNIYTLSSPSGQEMLVDKVYLAEDGSWCHWATGGKVNLLLAWGWKDEYFLRNRKDWGHEKCSYKITVDNDMSSVIEEMWKKGMFSDNFANAHWQIKELLKTGEVPQIQEQE